MDSRVEVISFLEQDLQAADFQWSLFTSALFSYRYDSVLRPFPPGFINRGQEDSKNIEELRLVASKVPALSDLLRVDQNETNSVVDLPQSSWDLLKWVFGCGNVTIHTRSRRNYLELLESSGNQTAPLITPDYIFEIVPSPLADRRFKEACQGYSVLYAYHGSRLDNFFSILHNGLLAHMNKNSLFGTGTYLSSELSVSMTFSPAGYGWKLSGLSREISCVAVCELADHPEVKCQNRTGSPTRAYASDTIAGKVPDRYYLVQNDAIVRVKYLLVYTSSAFPPVQIGRSVTNVARMVRHRVGHNVLIENKFWLALAAYGLVLCGIGLSSSWMFKQLVKKFFHWCCYF